jgi:alpha-tubulin suppressor-like RCC1 family protein
MSILLKQTSETPVVQENHVVIYNKSSVATIRHFSGLEEEIYDSSGIIFEKIEKNIDYTLTAEDCLHRGKTFFYNLSNQFCTYFLPKGQEGMRVSFCVQYDNSYAIISCDSQDDIVDRGNLFKQVYINGLIKDIVEFIFIGSSWFHNSKSGLNIKISRIYSGYGNSIIVDNHNDVWCCGKNDAGQLGLNSRDNISTPTAIYNRLNLTTIYSEIQHTLAIDTQGKLWSFGDNVYGKLGQNSLLNCSVPFMVCSNLSFTQIYCSPNHSLAIDSSGLLWSWGYGSQGRLGDNTLISKLTPVRVCSNLSFTQISCSSYHSLALDSSGLLWSWGTNTYGVLGDNTNISKLTPVRVCSNLSFTQISCGLSHSLAIDSTGLLWAWGANTYGVLGDNTTIGKLTPVRVCSNLSFVQISCGRTHSLAIDSTGLLWSWGRCSGGELGDNTAYTSKATPVRVCSNLSFVQISAGYKHSLALDSSGYLWGWGSNGFGELGNPFTIMDLTPVEITKSFFKNEFFNL